MCKHIEKLINEECLGSTACPANFIIECENGKIGNVKLTNDNTKKIMLDIFNIISIIYKDDVLENNVELRERKDKICKIFTLYIDYFVELWKDENKNNAQCSQLQISADVIIQLLVELWGVDHITNYFHYMESGHVDFFLRSCDGNLMQYAQQGWEAMNGKFKEALQRKTQRGGHSGVKGHKEPLYVSALRFTGRWLVHWLYPTTRELELLLNE